MSSISLSRKLLAALTVGAIASVAAVTAPASARVADDHQHAKVGAAAPDFTLTDTDGNTHTLSEYTKAGKIVVLEWFNPECPFVKKQYGDNTTMLDTYATTVGKDVVWLAINSGAPGKQGAGIELNKQAKTDWELPYPVLLDESGEVGQMFGAKTTPHMFIIHRDGTLVYNGAIDNNPSPRGAGDINYVADALKAQFNGETITVSETKPYGCSVKYGKVG